MLHKREFLSELLVSSNHPILIPPLVNESHSEFPRYQLHTVLTTPWAVSSLLTIYAASEAQLWPPSMGTHCQYTVPANTNVTQKGCLMKGQKPGWDKVM